MTQPAISRLADIKPSPAVKMALRLLMSGACKTKKDAATSVGLHPAYLTQLTNENDAVKQLMNELDNQLNDQTVDMSVIMNKLGRLGVSRIARLAVLGSSERIQLDAAKTLADRAPDTAGIQKIQAEGLSLSATDAKALAAALVESARLGQDYHHVAKHGLVEVDITQGANNGLSALPAPAGSSGERGGESQGSNNGNSEGDQGNAQERPIKLVGDA